MTSEIGQRLLETSPVGLKFYSRIWLKFRGSQGDKRGTAQFPYVGLRRLLRRPPLPRLFTSSSSSPELEDGAAPLRYSFSRWETDLYASADPTVRSRPPARVQSEVAVPAAVEKKKDFVPSHIGESRGGNTQAPLPQSFSLVRWDFSPFLAQSLSNTGTYG